MVAKTDGTDKILAGRRTPGCCVVKRSWLMQCYWSLTRRDPTPHLLPAMGGERESSSGQATGRTARGGPHPTDTAKANDESSDDDDDFAAEFEKDLM